MMPSVYGCSAQQSSTPPPPAPSIAISSVTFTTQSYGTTLAATPTGIPVNDKITTILNAGNSFTVPTDGLAQYYSNSNTSQQVFHTMEVAYTATNWVEADLPTNGNCQFVFQTLLNESFNNSQLNTWPLEGFVQGTFLPDSAKINGVRITTTPELNRSDVFLLSPILGEEGFDLLNRVQYLTNGVVRGQNDTRLLNNIVFAAQNLSASSSFDLVISVLLADGSYVTSPAQEITIPSGAVKTNLVGGIGINSFTTTTEAYGIQITGGGPPPEYPITAITIPSQIFVSALNTANGFTTPETATNVGMAQGYNSPDPTEQVLHSYVINIDTSALTLSDYPATELIVEYLFSWDADATNINPEEAGILWSGELGQPTGSTNVGSIFTTSGGVELDSINTNTIIPFASVDLPIEGDSNRDYNSSWKAYSVVAGEPVVAPYTVNLKVRIQKTDGSYSESAEVPLNITANGVLPTIIV